MDKAESSSVFSTRSGIAILEILLSSETTLEVAIRRLLFILARAHIGIFVLCLFLPNRIKLFLLLITEMVQCKVTIQKIIRDLIPFGGCTGLLVIVPCLSRPSPRDRSNNETMLFRMGLPVQ